MIRPTGFSSLLPEIDCQLVVGNVGTVYRGTDEGMAQGLYTLYVQYSQYGIGSSANEPVTLLLDGVINREYTPPPTELESDMEEARR
jgi:hypothetical protein